MSQKDLTHIREWIRSIRKRCDQIEQVLDSWPEINWRRGRLPIQLRPEEVTLLLAEYHKGTAMKDMEAMFGYSNPVLQRTLIDAGVKLRPGWGKRKPKPKKVEPTDSSDTYV